MEPNTAFTPESNIADREIEIDLLELIHFLLKRWRYLIVAAAIGFLVSSIYAFFLATPIYEATAQLYVVNSKDSALDLSDLQIGTYLTSDYELVFNTWEVNTQVKNNLNLPYSVDKLRSMVEVVNPSDTRALFITVSSSDPEEATIMANEYAEVSKQYIADTMLSETPTTLSVAQQPADPVKPRRTLIMVSTTIVSMLICAAALTILYLQDDKIKTASDLKKYLGAEPLAIIPVVSSYNSRKHRSISKERKRS